MALKLQLKLIRGTESTDNFLSIDDDFVIGDPVFTRKGFSETVNDIKVQYGRRTLPNDEIDLTSSSSSQSYSYSSSSSFSTYEDRDGDDEWDF